jgi:hypothetical protein
MVLFEDNVAKANSHRMKQMRKLPSLIEVTSRAGPLSFIHPPTRTLYIQQLRTSTGKLSTRYSLLLSAVERAEPASTLDAEGSSCYPIRARHGGLNDCHTFSVGGRSHPRNLEALLLIFFTALSLCQ